ncbi:MAG: purine-nucleoside phosphorylase [Nitrospirae bacterium]|nr:MAG: purine-nucleoside phosphorylase [Nitrospirota bacterium]
MAVDDPASSSVQPAVEFLRSRLPGRPSVGIILGSGLGGYADEAQALAAIPYQEIPGFPRCSVEGHAGRLVLTERGGACVAILQGRVHRYEGYALDTVIRPVRVLAALGVQTLIVTCAAGALDDAPPGTCMLIEDHLNLMGDNPLMGAAPGGGGFGGFVEMAGAYDRALLALGERAALAAGLPVRRGILAAVTGPTYETGAEAAMLGRLGAQAVSMSTVPEVIIARALGLRVLGLALITNQAGAPLDCQVGHRQVVAMATSKAAAIGIWLDGVLDGL